MTRTHTRLALAVALAIPCLAAQSPPREYDRATGLVTLIPSPQGRDVRVVTTQTPPGMKCEPADGERGFLPVMVLPPRDMLTSRTLAVDTIRGIKTLRAAAKAAGANAVVGFRSETHVTGSGYPRAFLYGTLARCE